MSSSKYLVCFTLLLLQNYLLFEAIAENTPPPPPTPLFHICSSTDGNFSNPSPYEPSLARTLQTLTSPNTTLATTGFIFAGTVYFSATSYGLALCRGDISSEECQSCAAHAAKEIRELCPNSKGARIWYEDCLLKYSSHNFYGKIDEQILFYLSNVNNVSHPKHFNRKTRGLLNKLSEQAVVQDDLFAAGESKLDSLTTIYGLVQCTRDLSGKSCKKCLQDAVSQLPTCCDGKQGGQVVGGSCYLRYEIYPFVKSQL